MFVRCADDSRTCVFHQVRVNLWPRGTGRLGPQVMIDIPSAQQEVHGPFVVAGWALDTNDPSGTGVDTVHVWAYPSTRPSASLGTGPQEPIFLGVAHIGVSRPDVAAVFGARFERAGYGLTVAGLEPGEYDIAVFAWSTVTGGFVPARTVHVTVR